MSIQYWRSDQLFDVILRNDCFDHCLSHGTSEKENKNSKQVFLFVVHQRLFWIQICHFRLAGLVTKSELEVTEALYYDGQTEKNPDDYNVDFVKNAGEDEVKIRKLE